MSARTLYLYPAPGALPSFSSVCCKVYLALRYAGLDFEVKKVFGRPQEVSPSGRLPALRDGDLLLCDSVQILDHLEGCALQRAFWPDDPAERARDRAWELFCDESFYWRGFYMRWKVKASRDRLLTMMFRKRPLLRRVFGPMITRSLCRRVDGQGTGLKSEAQVRGEIERCLDMVEAALGDGPFFEGRDAVGRADLALGGILPQFPHGDLVDGGAEMLAGRPALCDYVARVYEACGCEVPELG